MVYIAFNITHRSRIVILTIFLNSPKAQASSGIQGMLPLKSPLLGSESFRQDNGQFHSPQMKPCNLESIFLIKNISTMKNLTDF